LQTQPVSLDALPLRLVERGQYFLGADPESTSHAERANCAVMVCILWDLYTTRAGILTGLQRSSGRLSRGQPLVNFASGNAFILIINASALPNNLT
jgi:hypothetical protein